jgi:hypothetical protein
MLIMLCDSCECDCSEDPVTVNATIYHSSYGPMETRHSDPVHFCMECWTSLGGSFKAAIDQLVGRAEEPKRPRAIPSPAPLEGF